MSFKKMVAGFLFSMVAGTLGGALLLGLIGLYLAGGEGFLNGATWGAVLGCLGGLGAGSSIGYAGPSALVKHLGSFYFSRK